MAAQLTATKGPSERRLVACIARAIHSLPTPVSPVMRIELSARATRSASFRVSLIAGL